MHDPRFEPGMGVVYHLDATPGRHTQACQYFVAPGFESGRPEFGADPERQEGRGRWVKEASCLMHVVNASGVCLFGYLSMDISFVPDFLAAVTGQPYDVDSMILTGERIANIRQAFNARHGVNPMRWRLPGRAYGHPPLQDGPTSGISLEIEQMDHEHLDAMGWTHDGAVPRRDLLERLGMGDVAHDLWEWRESSSQ
jgi:aldehyde:ferredoxin oxidoreductase